METVKKFFAMMEKFFAITSGICLFIVFSVSFAQVIQRYVFQLSMPWATDTIRIFFVYSVFCGMCVGLIRKSHLNIDVVIKLLSNKGKLYLHLVSNIIMFTLLVYVFKESIPFIIANNNQYTPYLLIPMSYVYGFFPIIAIFMLAFLLFDSLNGLNLIFSGSKEEI